MSLFQTSYCTYAASPYSSVGSRQQRLLQSNLYLQRNPCCNVRCMIFVCTAAAWFTELKEVLIRSKSYWRMVSGLCSMFSVQIGAIFGFFLKSTSSMFWRREGLLNVPAGTLFLSHRQSMVLHNIHSLLSKGDDDERPTKDDPHSAFGILEFGFQDFFPTWLALRARY
jgi:hypothetical protein